MVTVKIYSVMFETEYEFCLDSNTPVSELCEEIGEVICQKEQCRINGKIEHLMLYSNEKRCIIAPSSTLSEYGIKTGDTLCFG